MNDALMKAILAMDSYNRGYGAAIALPDLQGTQIGSAVVLRNKGDTAAEAIGFYGIAYSYDGATVISYRGTDDFDSLDDFFTSEDAANGWLLGNGNYNAAQGTLAIEFYKDVTAQVGGPGDDLQTVDVSLTGHSLGGGLAGYVGALYGQDADIFDSMDYLSAATNAHFYASLSPSDPNYATLAAPLINLIYDGDPPWALDDNGVVASHIEGEALDSNFIRQVPSQEYSIGDNVDLPGIDAIGLHSMATMVMTLYADALADDDWKLASQYFWPVLYSDAFALSIGADVPGQLATDDKHADILRQVIAYSAIDEGTRVFGDTGIVALYDDANDLGKALGVAGVSDQLVDRATDISRVLVQFGGQLALNRVEGAHVPSPVEAGVLTYSDVANNRSLSIGFADDLWQAAGGGVLPDMVARETLVQGLGLAASHLFLDHAFAAVWGFESASEAVDRVVLPLHDAGGTLIVTEHASPTTGVTY